jgi:hypothetical protein
MESEKEWYYRRAGRQYGPFSSESIGEMIAEGLLDARQPIWNRNGDRFSFGSTADLSEENDSR